MEFLLALFFGWLAIYLAVSALRILWSGLMAACLAIEELVKPSAKPQKPPAAPGCTPR